MLTLRLGKTNRYSLLVAMSLWAIASCAVYDSDSPTGTPTASGGGGNGGTVVSGGSGGTGGSSGGVGGTGGSTGGSGGTTDGSVDGAGGTAGTSGAAGSTGGGGALPDGSAGKAGNGGASGSAGGDGAAGNGGTAGIGGVAGAAGVGGASGTSGAGGVSGASGASGAGGASGSAGSAGTAGTSGTGGTGGVIDSGPDTPPAPGAVFAVGSFAKSTTTGAQTVPHTLGQIPKALLLWTTGKTNETMSAGFNYGIGASDPTTSYAVAMSTKDAVTSTSSSRRMAAKAITLVQGGEVVVAEADLPSWTANDFSLNWTTNDNQATVIHYLAISGPQATAKLALWTAPTAAGSKAVTGIGFKPEVVLHFYVGAAFTTAPPTSSTNGVFGMGAMDKNGGQWAVQASDANASNPTLSSRAQQTDAAIYMYTDGASAAVTKEASFVSMDADGFTVNFTTANANAGQIFSLALGGMKASIGSFNKATGTAPASQPITTPGFKPGAVLLSSYQIAAQTAAISEISNCSYGIGASDGTHAGSSAFVSVNNTSPTSVDAIDKTSKAFMKMNSAPIDAEADLTSLDATGFTLNWTLNDGIASQIGYCALGAP